MSQFNEGDKVFIKRKADNDTGGTGQHLDVGYYFDDSSVWSKDYKYDGSEYIGLFDDDELELYQSPKFKVGYTFQRGSLKPYQAEIAKVAFNVAQRQFYYLTFDLDDGYAAAVPENEIPEPVCENTCKKEEEMTLAQVCKELGRTVKIVK